MTLRRSVPHLLALFLYSCLTLVLTYPGRVAPEGGHHRRLRRFVSQYLDCRLGGPEDYPGGMELPFDANIFFPYKTPWPIQSTCWG